MNSWGVYFGIQPTIRHSVYKLVLHLLIPSKAWYRLSLRWGFCGTWGFTFTFTSGFCLPPSQAYVRCRWLVLGICHPLQQLRWGERGGCCREGLTLFSWTNRSIAQTIMHMQCIPFNLSWRCSWGRPVPYRSNDKVDNASNSYSRCILFLHELCATTNIM